MSINRNSDTAKEVRSALALQLSADAVPVPIPVVESNPKLLRRINIVRRNTTTNAAQTIYTVPALPVRFFLVAIENSIAKDAAHDAANGRTEITFTPKGGAAQAGAVIAHVTLTAMTAQTVTSLAVPVELEPGSVLQLNGISATAGNVYRVGTIYGYTTEQPVVD